MSINNPSDQGNLQYQNYVIATVVDDKDPEESGRLKCRILNEQDDKGRIPDDKLTWYQCLVNGQPQLRGVGSFPSGNYCVGSKLVMINTGQQGYVILGALSNGEKDENTADAHPQSRSSSPKLVTDVMGNIMNRWWNGAKPPTEIPANTEEAYRLMNNITKTLQFRGDIKDAINKQAVTPVLFGSRPSIKVLEDTFKSFGRELFSNMDMKNPTKEVTRLSQELIPNAVSMLENLKSTAKSGSAILATNSFGGLQNILGGLSGIASFKQAESQRDNAADTANLLEELLRQLYRQLMKKEPLDENGRETVKYQKWKAAFLRGEVEIADVSS